MLNIYLEAKHFALKHVRLYHIFLTQDLFGDWLLTTTYGRLGTRGQTKIYAFKTAQDALPKIKSILLKRATAPQRSGCQYHIVNLDQNPVLPLLDVSNLFQSSSSFVQKNGLHFKKDVPLPLFDC